MENIKLRQNLTDFQDSFIGRFFDKFGDDNDKGTAIG